MQQSHVPSGHCRNCGYAMDPGRCPECGVECPDVSPRPRLPVWAVVCAVMIGLVPAVLAEVMWRMGSILGGLMWRSTPMGAPRHREVSNFGYVTMAAYAVVTLGTVMGLWMLLTRRERVRRVGPRGRRNLLWIMLPLAALVGFAGLILVGANLIPW